MHEMSVTRSMLNLVLTEASRAGARRITRINIVLGELSGIVPEAVEMNFEWMSKETPAEGAVLKFEKVPRQARCRRCGTVYEPQDFWWTCTSCQANEFEIIAGNELKVSCLEVE